MTVVRDPDFGRRVRDRRTQLALKQTECARAIGVSRKHWHNWETGYTRPRGKMMAAVAGVLRCDQKWLVFGDGTDSVAQLARGVTLLKSAIREFDRVAKSLKMLRK